MGSRLFGEGASFLGVCLLRCERHSGRPLLPGSWAGGGQCDRVACAHSPIQPVLQPGECPAPGWAGDALRGPGQARTLLLRNTQMTRDRTANLSTNEHMNKAISGGTVCAKQANQG